jgi:hypothetical protein
VQCPGISRRTALGALGSAASLLAAGRATGAGTAAAAATDKGPPPLQRGVQLGLFHEDPLWSYAGLLRELRELGTSHVGLTVAYYQDHAGSTEIYEHPRFTAPDAALVRTIDEAHALGLKVMVFPIVRLLKPRSSSEWRGTLRPEDPPAWWQSYEQRLLRLGRLCQHAHVAQLSVGSELSTLDGAKERPRWQALIERTRATFRGLLTYSGNWDHFEQVGLYDLLDTAGLCAYFPLAEAPILSLGMGTAPTPELPELVAAWRRKRTELEQFAARIGRPLVLTEVGYLSQRGCARKPWDEGAQNPVDLEEQRRCYAAFGEAWRGAMVLRGVYFWNYYGWGGSRSIGYTPRGKPAALEMARYFQSESARPAR